MKTYIVDAFTDVAFRGNPAGVCLVEKPLAEPLMLAIAQELNLSETAFVSRLDAPGRLSIRFFSPKMEIPLCGHATLASAETLFADPGCSDVEFVTQEGVRLVAKRHGDRTAMLFPRYETDPAEVSQPMLAALGLTSVEHVAYNEQLRILLLELGDPKRLSALSPDFPALKASHDSLHGVVVTSRSENPDYDFQSRYFWPWSGTDEDPVTGGTHTFLAPYWSQRLGKNKLRAFQASKRGGSMHLELQPQGLRIEAAAVIVLEGQLHLPENHR